MSRNMPFWDIDDDEEEEEVPSPRGRMATSRLRTKKQISHMAKVPRLSSAADLFSRSTSCSATIENIEPRKKTYKRVALVDAKRENSKVSRPRSAGLFIRPTSYPATTQINPRTKTYKRVAPAVDAEEEDSKMPRRMSLGINLLDAKVLHPSSVPKTYQRVGPVDFIGTKMKRDKQQKSQSHDGFVSSEDEGEEGMSMISSYKFSKKPIGFGAFGTCVYSGVNTKDGRKVAIKKINCHTKKQTHQYKREVKYLLLLSDCPNIVKYLNVLAGQNVVYIILELMEGTLETLVNQQVKFKITELCHDIISALYFLHDQSPNIIIHRDIKPRNILFVSLPRLKLKLADFGLSKMLDSDSSSIGYNGGTRCWMAPEVHRSLDHFSTASDVFATGLVVHYLMTSRHPFAPTDVTCTRENRLFVEHKIVDNILNQDVNVSSCISPEAVHLIKQMIKDDKDQRLNAGEVLAHPFFWSKKKKTKFLEATANQPEIYQKGANDFKKDLELTHLGAQFQAVSWSEQSDAMVYIYDEMMLAGRRIYNTTSVAELLRFMRNAYQHVSESGHTAFFREYLLKDFIFLKEFNSLFIDVYEVVLEHGWDENKDEIIYTMMS